MQNQDLIIEKYKAFLERQLHLLPNGRVVVGEEVDEENRLWYVIRDKEVYTIELAWSTPVLQSFPQQDGGIMHVDGNGNTRQG